jgi:hypothetical protein
VCSILLYSNLKGTLPDSIGAFSDITEFQIAQNAVGGTIPKAVGSWGKLGSFNVALNNLHGVLPNLPFSNMTTCRLLNPVNLIAPGNNSFSCPFPLGVAGKCQKFDASNWVPITAADCSTACYGASKDLPTAQCTAWQSIYDALGGAEWPKCSNNREDPCGCEVVGSSDGVECNKDGITKILLHVGLVGTIPPAIGALTNLNQLALNDRADQGLTGSIPDALGGLPLVGLWVNGKFDGTEFPPWIQKLSSTLSSLWLLRASGHPASNCKAQLPESFRQMTELLSVTFREPCLTGSIPDSIGQLTKLHYL